MSKKIEKFNNAIQYIYEKITRSRLIFMIGDRGINVLYYKKNILIESYFCPLGELTSNKGFEEFLKQHAKADAKFIVNFKEITLQHEALPVFEGLAKIDPVEKYCDTHFHKSDLYTSKVYSITRDQADIWKAVIIWIPVTTVIERCLDLVKQNNITLAGVYFQSVSLQSIAAYICRDANINISEYIYAVVSVTSEAGITITINHGNNILASIICEYPLDKSAEYIQGVIEQNLADMWLKFKTYTNEHALKKLNIFILPKNLKTLISAQTYEVENSLFAKDEEENTDIFADSLFIKYFRKSDQTQATSKELKGYYRYHLINNVIFKAAYASILMILLYGAYIKKEIMYYNKLTSSTYTQYSEIIENIRLQAQNFPTVLNVAQLADLYNIDNQLVNDTPLPFELIKDFLALSDNSFTLNKVNWNIDDSTEDVIFHIDFEVFVNRTDSAQNLENINKFIKDLEQKHPGLKIQLQRINNDAINESNKPLAIKIKVSGGKNDN